MHISALHLYPIKGCQPVAVETASVATTGLEGDREWQLSSELTPITQRQNPVLATVRAEPIAGGLRLSAPDRPTIEVERPTANDAVTGSMVGVKVDVGDAGDEAAGWFASLLDDDSVRLVARTDESELVIPEPLDVFGQTIAFGDVAPVLVAATASHEWLAEQASEPFGIDRFRANIVVETSDPFVEDTWASFRIGSAELRHGLIWPRCAVPQVDQVTGERHGEPAKVLRAHRWCESAPGYNEVVRSILENKGVFGVGCAIGPAGATISIGDELVVDEVMEPTMAPPPSAR